MGTLRHEAVLVTALTSVFDDKREDIDSFREALSAPWSDLLVGPIDSVTNGYQTMTFLPDGSKQGWKPQFAGHQMRDMFMSVFDGTSASVIRIDYGGDDKDEVIITVPEIGKDTLFLGD